MRSLRFVHLLKNMPCFSSVVYWGISQPCFAAKSFNMFCIYEPRLSDFLNEQQKSSICMPLVLFSTNTVPVTVCGTDCDILRFAHTFLSASVSSSALMPQRSEWRSSGRTADSCSSVSRMLRRPNSLLCLVLLVQVLPARCRPTSADEGTLPFLLLFLDAVA